MRVSVVVYVIARLIYSLSLTVTLIMTLLMTSSGRDVDRLRLVTSLGIGAPDVITVRANQIAAGAELSLLSDASKQRDTWRRDVTACYRHVTSLSAHVSRLTSGETWRHLDTRQLPGSFSIFLFISLSVTVACSLSF